MPAYTFSFPAAAGGLPVVVNNQWGDGVAEDTLGFATDVQGAVTITANLTPGTYVAVASDPTVDAVFTAPGTLDVPSSLIDLAGAQWLFEAGTFAPESGGTIAANGSESIVFGSVPEDFTAGSSFTIPSGLYILAAEINFDDPVDPRTVRLRVPGVSGLASCGVGPVPLVPNSTSIGLTVNFSGIALMGGEANALVVVDDAVASDVVAPEALTFSYAMVSLTRIA